MPLTIAMDFVIVLAAIWMGARCSGDGLGLGGAVGLPVLVVAFGVNPTSPPIAGPLAGVVRSTFVRLATTRRSGRSTTSGSCARCRRAFNSRGP